MADAALAFHEPSIVTILEQTSFLLALNIIGFVFDHVFYCGLVGQVLIGMALGTPGAKILPRPLEETVTQLGYLGLILIVFEGGLATSAKSLGRSLILSFCVALTGIGVPIALSFTLLGISNATKLQAFAAGASLCSTSLGTTFSLLKATNLTSSRLGTVLTSAAMLDDIVGLVLVQVISNLGSGETSVSAATIVRPICVSLAFAICLPAGCYFSRHVISTCLRAITFANGKFPSKRLGFSLPLSFLFSTTVLIVLCIAARYAGTSILFAAYLAGAIVAWIDEITTVSAVPRVQSNPRAVPENQRDQTAINLSTVASNCAPTQVFGHSSACVDLKADEGHAPVALRSGLSHDDTMVPPNDDLTRTTSGRELRAIAVPAASHSHSHSMNMYSSYYSPVVNCVLKPFFFASIGFSIPISKMFRGAVIWRGFVYAMLMAIGKLCCGLWLLRFRKPGPRPQAVRKDKRGSHNITDSQRSLPRPKSLYPAVILGCAMVARGEIGFLIAALAATNGIFVGHDSSSSEGNDSNLTSELYLVVTWAILLCTVAGPLALGFLAKRVKRLQEKRAQDGGAGASEDPLGIWGLR